MLLCEQKVFLYFSFLFEEDVLLLSVACIFIDCLWVPAIITVNNNKHHYTATDWFDLGF